MELELGETTNKTTIFFQINEKWEMHTTEVWKLVSKSKITLTIEFFFCAEVLVTKADLLYAILLVSVGDPIY